MIADALRRRFLLPHPDSPVLSRNISTLSISPHAATRISGPSSRWRMGSSRRRHVAVRSLWRKRDAGVTSGPEGPRLGHIRWWKLETGGVRESDGYKQMFLLMRPVGKLLLVVADSESPQMKGQMAIGRFAGYRKQGTFPWAAPWFGLSRSIWGY